MRQLLLLFICLSALLAPAPSIMAEAPDGYYMGINGLKDSELKLKLRDIISNNKKNDYNGLFAQCFVYTDARNDGTWWDMYSDIRRYIEDGWSGMNREHSLPKSWWGGSQQTPAYTDLNHLYPSDGPANMKKSNYPLGEVDPTGVSYDNGVCLVGRPVKGQGGGSDKVFEPDDEYKGDFARTYFYMATRYSDLTWKYTYMMQNGTYPTLQGWAIEMLLKWHHDDPVSDKERDRNDEVYRLQYNRNPFIDMPTLADYIWGEKKGQPFEDEELPPAGEGTLISPVNFSTVAFGDVVKGTSHHMQLLVKGQVSDNISLIINDTDKADFSIPVTSISWKDVNSAQGYTLDITFKPTTTGDKEASLIIYDGNLQGVTSYVVYLTGTAHEAPAFDRVVALDPVDVSWDRFTATWEIPSRPEVVDCYQVNIREYINGDVNNLTLTTDGDENRLVFDNVQSGATYSYTVQSSRFGMLSPESNLIQVTLAGIDGISAPRSLSVVNIGRGVQFACDKTQTNVRIIDMTGRTVRMLPEVTDGHCELLPWGAYLITSDQCAVPAKILIRD